MNTKAIEAFKRARTEIGNAITNIRIAAELEAKAAQEGSVQSLEAVNLKIGSTIFWAESLWADKSATDAQEENK